MNQKKYLNLNHLNESALDLSKTGTWEYNPTTKVLLWSRQLYKIHKSSIEQDISIPYALSFYQKEDKEKLQQSINDCINHKQPFNLQLKLFFSKNDFKVVRIIGHRTEQSSDEKTIEGYIHDITELALLQEEVDTIKKSRRELTSILDMATIISQTDPEGNIRYVNTRFLEVSGYNKEEVIGQPHSIVNSGYHTKEFFENLWDTITKGSNWSGEIKNQAKDGRFFWLDSLIHPLVNDEKEIVGFLSVSKDISEHKQSLELDLRTAHLMSLGESSAQIMHDVMNPLGILQVCEYRLADIDYSKDVKNQVLEISKIINRNVGRIQSIFTDIRSTMVGDTKMETVSLRNIIKDSMDLLELKVETNQVRVLMDDSQDKAVIGNHNLLVQVVSNLVKNSIEAISNLQDKWIKLAIHSVHDKTILKITDCGTGIPTEIQSKMFNSFFTTKENSGGTGLGLGLCLKIMKLHGGTIRVNNDSTNTEFDIIFTNLS